MSALATLSNDLAAAVDRAARAVVAVNARPRLPSTGIHWRPGVVVTADHTVRADDGITVTTSDGRAIAARLAGRDPGTDLAVLRLDDAAGLATADLGDAAALKVGHVVLAIGDGPRVSWGVVSALGGRWQTWRGAEIDRLVRLDLTLYPGFSGGPLVDAEGRVVGVNTSGLARRLELAVPATTVGRVVDELVARGRVSRGYLGVGLRPVRVPDDARRAVPAAGPVGLIVVSLRGDGPAAAAGLLLGDVLLVLDGAPVGAPEEVQAVVAGRRVGDVVTASILRAGAPREMRITLGERPARGR